MKPSRVNSTVSRDNAKSLGSLDQKRIWINTWNNWAEGIMIKPTVSLGPEYPTGNYKFDFLKAVREGFGLETFGT